MSDKFVLEYYMDRLGVKAESEFREIQLSSGESLSSSRVLNRVRASKFTLLRALPHSLINSLIRPSALWFFAVILIESNAFHLEYRRTYATFSLFFLRLFLSICKYISTLRLYQRADVEFNSVTYTVWDQGRFQQRKSSQLKVGDCLLIRDGGIIPADVVCLSSSSQYGTCFVSVHRIFGEGNLVLKSAVPPTHRFLQKSAGDYNLSRLQATVKVEPPNADFSRFSGTIKLPGLPRTVPLKPDHFLPRGSVLRGEDWILAVIVYAGMETKFWSNVQASSFRMSRLERRLSCWVAAAAVAVLALTGTQLLLQRLCSRESVSAEDFVLYLSVYQNLVPLVLFIALDVLRLVFALQGQDKEERVDMSAACSLEDLGEVQYILADKTGTVTNNNLEFVAVLLGSQMYTKFPIFASLKQDTNLVSEDEALSSVYSRDAILSFTDLKLRMQEEYNEELQRFCECVTLCNSMVVLRDNSKLATNTDEAALMAGAKELGFELINRGRDECDIDYFDMCHSYQVLCVKKFTPEVKRMRILVQQEIDDFATLYIKGSFATLRGMMDMTQDEQAILERRIKQMEQRGLRTMVLCYRRVEGDYLNEVRIRAMNAMSASLNVEGKLEVLLQELEHGLQYLGVTGVLDHSDEATAAAISDLAGAGVCTWLMSGEGESNTLAAIHRLEVLPANIEIVSLRGLKKTEDCHKRMSQVISGIILAAQTEASEFDAIRFSMLLRERIQDNIRFVLSIDGESFDTAIQRSQTRRLLLSLLLAASSVCFHSMSPTQKRQVAKLMRTGMRSAPLTLSIGDEMNDVPMLKETHFSAGISGASIQSFSDIRVPDFARLARVLLSDGRRFSALATQTVLLFLYAQVLFAAVGLTLSFLGDYTPYCWSGFGTKAMYSTVFTSLPILYIGCTNLPKSAVAVSDLTHDLDLRPLLHFSLPGVQRCLWLALLHYAALAACLFPAFFSGATAETASDEVAFLLLLAMVAAVNVHCAVEASRFSPQLLAISTACVGLVFAFEYGVEADLTTLSAVFRTPRLLLGLVGAVLFCYVSSVAYSCYLRMRDFEPYIVNSNKVFPLRLDAGLRKIRRTSTATLMQSVNQKKFRESAVITYELNTKAAAFKAATIESDFQRSFISENIHLLWTLAAVTAAVGMFLTVLELTEDQHSTEVAYKAMLLAAVLFFPASYALRSSILLLSLVFCLAVLVVIFTVNLVLGNLSVLVYYSVTVYSLLFIREKWTVAVTVAFLATVLQVGASGWTLLRDSSRIGYEEDLDIAGAVLVQILVFALSLKLSYRCAIKGRSQYQLIKQCEVRIAESDSILACLLPDFVCKQVKDGTRYIAEDKGKVSVIFIDICHFDEICAMYAPQDLTALLDDIFQKIDEMCASLQVAKIETVGKTYLACAGLRDFEFESTGEYIAIPHAKRCLDLAFAVLSSFRNYKLQSDELLSFKIGINTGEVIAGVVGFHKPQFSLVGDTVNTGSRMSSTLQKSNSVQISESTYRHIADLPDYQFEPRKIPVKGKGEMQTFIVTQTPFHLRKPVTIAESVESLTTSPARIQQRSSLRANFSALDLSELYNRNEKELVERVSLFAHESTSLETAFRLKTLHGELSLIRLGLAVFSVVQVVLAATRLGYITQQVHESAGIAVCHALLAGCGCALLLPRLVHVLLLPWCLVVLHSISAWCLAADSAYAEGFRSNFSAVLLGLEVLLMHNYSGMLFRHSVTVSVSAIVPSAAVWMSASTDMRECAVFFLLLTLQCCVLQYHRERSLRTFYNTSNAAEKEIEKTEQLLTQMLPVQAYESLRSDQWSTDRLLDVAILYADISGFTAWSSQHTPYAVIDKLSKIFTLFDKICVQKGMHKVHTIGDCYVALSSTSNKDNRDHRDECLRMVSFALEMVDVVDEICKQDNEQLKMRIGVHVGEVVGGIIGSRVVRYDIYGPDVLVANKMESNGKEGRVNVSSQAKSLLEQVAKDQFRFQFNKHVEVPEVDRHTDAYFVCRAADKPVCS